jgi:hypothetical protein
MKIVTSILLFVFSALCQANQLSTTSQQEITHLFSYLEHSGCQFNRNGSWHNSKDAAAHLDEKYQYLLKKNQISSTETFIEKAASKSSITGTPYQVKCGNAASVESAVWFKTELDKYRQKLSALPK